MRKIVWATTVIMMLVSLTLRAQQRGAAPPAAPPADPKILIDAAAKALGGLDLTSIQYSGTGTNNAFGQAWGPNRPWPAFKITSYTASINYGVPAMRVELERTNPDGPARGGGGLPLAAPQKQITVVSKNLAWNVAAAPAPGTPAATPAPANVNDRLLQIWMTPHGAIKAAELDPNVKADNRTLTFQAEGSAVKVTLGPDDLPERVETRADTPMLGDTVTETIYVSYRNFGNVKFPSHIQQRQGGFAILDLNITDVKPNAAVMIEVPANVQQAAAQPPPAPAPVKVDTQKIADGIYYLTGGTHHSVAVEFSDHVVVIEAPLNDERVMAVLDAVKKAIPNKPIRYVVNTHDHFDHAGGLRAVVAEGITIITQAQNKPYYERALAMPHTINPDQLTKSPKPPVIETVDDKRVLMDGTRTLELIRLSSAHSDTMLIGYLPKEKILIEADLFNPPAVNAPAPAAVNPITAGFYASLQQMKLEVNQILPLHGRAVTMKDLQAAVGKSATN